MSQKAIVLAASNGSLVYVVGTTPFSERSQEEVALVINTVKPNSVVLELCPNMKQFSMVDVDSPKFTSPFRVSEGLINSIRKVGFFPSIFEQFLLNTLCNNHLLPGAEYCRAVIEAKKYCNHVCLSDRPLNITISRLISMMGWIKFIKFIALVYFSIKYRVNEGVLNTTETDHILQNLLAILFRDYSELKKVIITENIKCFTYVLQKHAGIEIDQAGIHVKEGSKIVVGIVRSNYIPAILKYWGTITKEEYEQLSSIIPESRTTRAINFVCKESIRSMILWGIIETTKALKRILI